MMGLVMFSGGLMVLALRAWVMHDGGLPDGGTRESSRRDHVLARANRSAPSGQANSETRVVVGKGSG
jgi:hypothetical protein